MCCPIVNENDTVSTAEFGYLDDGTERIFGDNDRLAALVMSKLEGDPLILLTDVDGLFRNLTGEAGGSSNGSKTFRPLASTLKVKLSIHD